LKIKSEALIEGRMRPTSTVIARHRVGASRRPMTGSNGRSSITAFVVEAKGRGVLDIRLWRAMTASDTLRIARPVGSQ
jgi:hypothetical protein